MSEGKKSFFEKFKKLLGKILPDKDAKRVAALTCEGCGRLIQFADKEEYGKYVTFTVLSTDYKSKEVAPSQPPEKGKNVQIKARLRQFKTVEIEYTCPDCGKKTKIQYCFMTAETFKEVVVDYVQSGVRMIDLKQEVQEAMDHIEEAHDTFHSINHPEYNPKTKSKGKICLITAKNFEHSCNKVFVTFKRSIEEAVECMFTRLDFNPRDIRK